jgi:hypothetical protein
VEGAGEQRVDLSGRPLHPLLERLRSAGVSITGDGAGRVSLQAVRTGSGEAVGDASLSFLDANGPVCAPCAAGNLVRVGSGWYRVQAAGPWTVDNVQIVVDEGGYENETLAAAAEIFVPAGAVFQVRVALAPVAPTTTAQAPPPPEPAATRPGAGTDNPPARTAAVPPREQPRPTRAESEPPPRQAPGQIDAPNVPVAPAERPREDRPAVGTLAVRGSIPDGIRAVVVGPSGERGIAPGAEVALPAGAYTVRVSGLYRETVDIPVTIGAESTASVTLATPPIAPAIVAASRNVVQSVVQALARRSNDLLPLFPPDQRQSYRSLFESRAVSNWNAQLTSSDDAPTLAGEDIAMGFAVAVSFTQQNVATQLPIRFRAHLEQAGNTWRARSLDILR